MVRRTALTVALLGGCVWCLALVARADTEPKPDSVAFKPAASIQSLMYGQVQHFKAMGELVADVNAEERTERLVMEAGVLAELANVNIHHKDKPDYQGWARRLRDMSLEFAAEAKKGKESSQLRLEALRQKMKEICVACHDVYQ